MVSYVTDGYACQAQIDYERVGAEVIQFPGQSSAARVDSELFMTFSRVLQELAPGSAVGPELLIRPALRPPLQEAATDINSAAVQKATHRSVMPEGMMWK
jgi:hypothetical protein